MKKRLDVLLCEQNPELTKSQAQRIIMSGIVYVNNQKELKAGSMFSEEQVVEIRGSRLKYVSRGGLKLEKALNEFELNLNENVCMDIGSSTGGFTDCMLQNGAKKVYCVDVGKGQLHYKLREDERVVVMEKTNIRYVSPDMIDDVLDFISIDVSFISLTLVLPVAISLLNENKKMVMLIKPQFEAGKEKVGKKGVVKDQQVHEEVIRKIVDFVLDNNLKIAGLTYSPVKGPEGNIEYLLYINNNYENDFNFEVISNVVKEAHEDLDK